MDQKIFNNIVLFLIILIIIKNISPHPDSVLYILQKYLNYIIYKIKNILAFLGLMEYENFKNFYSKTFTGIIKYNDKTPSFKTSHEVNYVKNFKNLHPDIDEKTIYKMYSFIKSLISIDTERFFNTPSDFIENTFNQDEINKLQNIILNKLNSGNEFTFSELSLEIEPKYYLNINGRELEPFIINVKSNIGLIRIYVDINIRNDVYENKEFVVINDIKPIIDNNIALSDQNIIYNNVKSKTKKTPFRGDANLIFNNKTTDDYTYEDIEIENMPNINSVENENHSVYQPEIIKETTTNLYAFNEYDNLNFIDNNVKLNDFTNKREYKGYDLKYFGEINPMMSYEEPNRSEQIKNLIETTASRDAANADKISSL